MTLSTNVAIRLPEGHDVTPREMFDVALRSILDAAKEKFDNVQIHEDETSIGSVLGQGLPGIVDVKFGADGAPHAAVDKTNRDVYPEDCKDADAEYGDHLHTPACTFYLDFDTAYAYHGENGQTCTTLHGRTIFYLQDWVAQRGGSLLWHNEYAGTWHEFADKDGWDQFLGNGDAAMSWFQNVAKPAINKMLGEDARIF